MTAPSDGGDRMPARIIRVLPRASASPSHSDDARLNVQALALACKICFMRFVPLTGIFGLSEKPAIVARGVSRVKVKRRQRGLPAYV